MEADIATSTVNKLLFWIMGIMATLLLSVGIAMVGNQLSLTKDVAVLKVELNTTREELRGIRSEIRETNDLLRDPSPSQVRKWRGQNPSTGDQRDD